ncbi:two-component system LytT family response regulator [Aquimarina sp. EL_43]|uniref:LytR/AlgR family response regulator transcription factor n=1 Tax=Aquimarina TaxID=290174 RepID=UPI000472CCCC|nr:MULTISPECIES: LytTR family DNA-binding domain-containing protein [Aquimarina]MBG6131591.1 two-component system LytT family response regulator [Aquimarina sp. EL_35]MBG6152052.1 two-component system LytT family response regulator [Aquimarina sp. EL_32]MBG6170004.1 two-component system LytT family response regulator [Aquimarina sp. EL_43]
MSLTAIIVDDEKHSREALTKLIEEFCLETTVLTTANSVTEAIDKIKSNKPDVVFLDIELQSGIGFDILTQIDTINFEVIFTTAYEQYAIQAIKFSSLDYLLKPLGIEELKTAVEKAKKKKDQEVYKKQLETLIDNLQQQPKFNKICLSTADSVEFINIQDIIYCKANGAYTSFILKNNISLLVSKHLKEYENLLIEQQFMRTHNSFLINLKEVKKFVKSDGGYIMMNNNDIINISKNKKEKFLIAMSHIQ